jgi:acyl-coenzyme A thioesterase 13
MKAIHGGTIASMVDLGGSLAVASTGRFATGVTTDLNGVFTSQFLKETYPLQS